MAQGAIDSFISIPTGTIKSFTAIITADVKNLFQFLLVRLKDILMPNIQLLIILFQFPLVR